MKEKKRATAPSKVNFCFLLLRSPCCKQFAFSGNTYASLFGFMPKCRVPNRRRLRTFALARSPFGDVNEVGASHTALNNYLARRAKAPPPIDRIARSLTPSEPITQRHRSTKGTGRTGALRAVARVIPKAIENKRGRASCRLATHRRSKIEIEEEEEEEQ